MSLYTANPRIDHLHQLIHIFYYLRNHMLSWLQMDPLKSDVTWSGPQEERPSKRRKIMRTLYRYAKEEIPIDAPDLRGNRFQVSAHVETDHAGNNATRR